jgi:hypothetical protein
MAKVFTTVPGSVIRIGRYGEASNDSPATIPDDVAAELTGRADLRVEREVVHSSAKAAEKKQPDTGAGR